MNVLGIAGRHRQAAVALAVKGTIAAAATEDVCVRIPGVGYAQTGGLPYRAIEACLTRAGLSIGEIDQLAVVDEPADGEPMEDEASADGVEAEWRAAVASRPVSRVDPVDADGRQCAVATNASDVLVFSLDPPMFGAYRRTEGELRVRSRATEVGHLACAVRTFAGALGAIGPEPFLAIDRLSVRGDAEFADEMQQVMRWRQPCGLVVDPDGLAALTRRALDGVTTAAPELSAMNIRAQQRRSALAASFVDRLASVVCDATREVLAADRVCLGGSLFTGARLNTRLQQLLGDAITIAPVPELAGRAIGAAADLRTQTGVDGLALGPAFTEPEIKATLDNCRLDYVYEPDWRRLLTRVSKMLSRGMVIGWFQGPMVFGPRSLGTRSVLADPSTRYARENVNEYLKRRPLDEPLPVSFVPERAAECLATPLSSPFMLLDAAVRSPWRDRLRSALDHRHELRAHTVTTDQAPELVELLQIHFDRSGVPGLINTTLNGPGEPIACTPRDAVRTVYSSAIDALVIGRFLLMKDYWLLRSDAS